MSHYRLPQQLAKNASRMHKLVGQLLTEEMFNCYEIRQEYPVNMVNPSFSSGREKFDWVLPSLKIIIEVHGEAHYNKVCFGGMAEDEAKIAFRKQMERDQKKQEAALEAGWSYVVVKYDEKNLTADMLRAKISKAIAEKKINTAKNVKFFKPKAKIQNPGEYKWPTKKIPSRPFQKKQEK